MRKVIKQSMLVGLPAWWLRAVQCCSPIQEAPAGAVVLLLSCRAHPSQCQVVHCLVRHGAGLRQIQMGCHQSHQYPACSQNSNNGFECSVATCSCIAPAMAGPAHHALKVCYVLKGHCQTLKVVNHLTATSDLCWTHLVVKKVTAAAQHNTTRHSSTCFRCCVHVPVGLHVEQYDMGTLNSYFSTCLSRCHSTCTLHACQAAFTDDVQPTVNSPLRNFTSARTQEATQTAQSAGHVITQQGTRQPR